MFTQIPQQTKMTEAMNLLAPDHRDILVMVCVKSMSYEQVSETMNIPVGSVRALLSRARETLQTILETPIPAEKKHRYIPPMQPGYLGNLKMAGAA